MARSRTTHETMADELTEAKESLALPDEQVRQKIQRRRTQDEMEHALHLLLSGQPRPRDDESEQVLRDTIGEVAALRQLNIDLMQAISTSYQNGMAAIRELTSR